MVIPGNIALFRDISVDERIKLLGCLHGITRHFQKGDTIVREGSPAESVGIILSGAVHIVRTDYEGTRTIQAFFGAGSLFSESFACASIPAIPVSVVAVSDCEILLIPFSRIVRPCSNLCGMHQKLIENMMYLLAQKNIFLNDRLEILSARTIREKVLILLSLERKRQNTQSIVLPFSRTALAEYLCVDRSALWREMEKMKSEGLLSGDVIRWG